MPRKARDVRSKLTDKFGFVRATGRASDHEYYQLDVPHAPRVVTKLSWGKTEIRDDILAKMALQLKVSGPQFARMIDCTLGPDEYTEKVVERARLEGRYR